MLGWEKTAVIGWSGRRGVKSPCFLAGRGAGVGDGLARPAKPGPTNVIPLIPRGQGLSVVIGKKVPSPRGVIVH